jgi:hypothetical protein
MTDAGSWTGTVLVGSDFGRPAYLSMTPRTHQTLMKVEFDEESSKRIGSFAEHAINHSGSFLQCSVKLDEPFMGDELPEKLSGKVRQGRPKEEAFVLEKHATIQVLQVLHHRALPEPAAVPDDAGSNGLSYLLFGDAETGLYLAHLLRDRDDFDQLLRVQINGETFTEAEIERQGRPTVQIADTGGADRLSDGQTVQAHSSAGQHHHRDIEVVVIDEV